jgi:hypothetical protein
MFFGNQFLTPYRRINDVLLSLRNLRDRWKRRKIAAPHSAPKRDVELTVLAGDMGAIDGDRLREISAVAGSVQLLGFRFGQGVDFPREAFEVSEIEGCLFPEFHGVLAGALARIAGLRLVVLTPDLPGLGLGLLHNFHFGTPLYLSAGVAGVMPVVDWNEPGFLDPAGDSWKSYLAGFVDQVPRRQAPGQGERRVLPAAGRFADGFAEFYLRTRILE